MCLVSIISVNYNQPQVTIAFLESVRKNTNGHPTEVILVDNGSSENEGSLYRDAYPDLKYITSAVNLGFAGGNNLGIRHATGEFLLFLNNDTELSPNLIDVMVNEFRLNPSIGLLSPLILFYDDKRVIQYAGFTKMNYLTGRNNSVGYKEIDKNQYDFSQETGFVHGAAMMCRREDLKITGLMSENYFLYYEELDWCERFRNAGKQIWFTGKTKVYHKESISVGKESALKTYFMNRNRLLFIRKNTGLINTVLFTLFYVFAACPKTILQYYRKGRGDLIPWVFKAIGWNLRNSKESLILGFNNHHK